MSKSLRFLIFGFVGILISSVIYAQSSLSTPADVTVELVESAAALDSTGSLSCFNPWESNGLSLTNRVRRLIGSPYRTGFGAKATGGTANLVVVTNPASKGAGTFDDVISKAQSGDYIIFDSANDVYLNGCIGGGCKVPGSVTIDGSLPNGKYVTLLKQDADTYNRSLRFSDGNNIVTNLFVDHRTRASAIGISNGENYWFDSFQVHSHNDDALTIGSATSNPENSADMVTISRYKVLDGPKGFQVITGGSSCNGYTGNLALNFNGGAPTDVAINQRRAHVTIIQSEIAANTRNIMNNGGYVDIIGSHIHGDTENTITRYGGQTIVRHTYVDSRTVATRALRADAGIGHVGKNAAAPSFCPQIAEIFLQNNIYRQKSFVDESNDPRINYAKSDIDSGDGGQITDGQSSWSNPPAGRAVFTRPYEGDVSKYFKVPVIPILTGPDFTVQDHCY